MFNHLGQSVLQRAFEGYNGCIFAYGQTGWYLSRLVGKPTMWFPNWSDTNQAVQLQKRARSLKFRILVEEELYYPSSENKGADQLRGYREADLRLCFLLCRLLVFPCGGSFIFNHRFSLY